MKVNLDETRAYYASLGPASLCDCGYCRNYCLRIKKAYPEVAAYLDTLGVDIEKPFETLPLEPDESGMLEYSGCQYIVFGRCAKDYEHWLETVSLRRAFTHPDTGIAQEHFVLECYPIQLRYEG